MGQHPELPGTGGEGGEEQQQHMNQQQFQRFGFGFRRFRSSGTAAGTQPLAPITPHGPWPNTNMTRNARESTAARGKLFALFILTELFLSIPLSLLCAQSVWK